MKKLFLLMLTLFCFSSFCFAEEIGVKSGFDFKKSREETIKHNYLTYLDLIMETRKVKVKLEKKKEEKRQIEAIEKIIAMSNPTIKEEDKKKFIRSIIRWSDFYNLESVYVASVIHRESNFRNNFIDNGMYGPMQINVRAHMKKLQKYNYTPQDIKRINPSVRLGCEILREYIDKTGCKFNALYRYVGSKNAHYYVRDVKRVYLSYSVKQ